MRQRVTDNRPDINTEITADCPITRRILAINLFICSFIMSLAAWHVYQKVPLSKPFAFFVFLAVMYIRGGIWYVRSVPRRFNRDMQIIIYGMIICTTLAIIKWVAFWYWKIDTFKMPSIYEKWDHIFDIVGIAIAYSAAGLPDVIKQQERRRNANKSVSS